MPEFPSPPASQPEEEGLRTVVIALLANLGVAVAKFVAAFLTGSSAMLAEAFHASADTGNQVLLLLSDRFGRRPPDAERPLGHGREAYFWSLLASLGVFLAGSLLSFRQGVKALLQPEPLSSLTPAYVILLVSFVLDGISLLRAYRQIRSEADTLSRGFLEHLDLSSDPVARAVFAEDAAALLGNVVALAGIVLHKVTGSAVPDGVAALVIGAGLAVVAFNLTRRNRDFLIGQEASPDVRKRLQELIAGQPGIIAVRQLLVTFLGPRRLWVLARLELDDALDVPRMIELLTDTERMIRQQSPVIARVDLVPRAHQPARVAGP